MLTKKNIIDIEDRDINNIINACIYNKTEGKALFMTEEEIEGKHKEIIKIICMVRGYDYDEVLNNDIRIKEFVCRRIKEENYEINKFFCIKDNINTNPNWYVEYVEKNGKSKRFKAYSIYLEKNGFSRKTIESLEVNSNKIMELIVNPSQENKDEIVTFRNIGMIMADVQSGKTSLFISVINKSIDAGYRLVILIAGTKTNLRNQLQKRIEEGCCGIDMVKSEITGIGHELTDDELNEISIFTSRDEITEEGRIKSGELASNGYNKHLIKDKIAVVVCTRQYQVTERLIKWCKAQVKHFNSERGKLQGIPTLIIGDEADEATINVGNLRDISKNNRNTRELINMIDQVNYIGVTATPYANIYIDPNVNDEEVGEDIFPKNFLCYIEPSNSYVGADIFFREQSPYVYIAKEDDFNEEKEIFNEKNPGLNNLLKKALNNFILVIAIRELRGYYNKYNTMLIHIDRKTYPQSCLKNIINDYLALIRSKIILGDTKEFNNEILNIWEEIKANESRIYEIDREKGVSYIYRVDFTDDEICEMVKECIMRVKSNRDYRLNVKEVNSTSKGERLDYDGNEVEDIIAVGGQVLSRGFTMEGLSISLLLRESIQMDTLLQNCRFFSHYPCDYRDLVKLYTTEPLNEWLSLATKGNKILIDQIKDMDKKGKTPTTYGLYMKRVKAKLEKQRIIEPTSKNKMKNAYLQVRNSCEDGHYGGEILEMATFFTGEYGDKVNTKNLDVLNRLISALEGNILHKGKYEESQNIVWMYKDLGLVIEFIKEVEIPSESRFMKKIKDSKNLLIYDLERGVNKGSIKSVDVVLINNFDQKETKGVKFTHLEYPIYPVNRKVSKEETYCGVYQTAYGKSTQNRDLRYGLEDYEERYIFDQYGRSYDDSNPPKEEAMKDVRTRRKSALLLLYIQNAELISKSGAERGMDEKVCINPISFSLFIPGVVNKQKIASNDIYYRKMKESLDYIVKGDI